MQYRREIDGLRAIAVVPVILFHAGFTTFSGGFVGVDVFFVISGYLITSILLDEMQTGRFSIGRFYERRARRILPALFVVALASVPFAYLWMMPEQLKDFAASLFTATLALSNLYFLSQISYFSPAAEVQPLVHTWSLAIEEQYYLLFPFLLLALRKRSRRVQIASLGCLMVLSFGFSEWGWRTDPARNFFFTLSRFWEIMAGSLCALVLAGRAPGSSNFLSAFGLALILIAVVLYDAGTPSPSAYILVPILGTALIILFGDQTTWTARLLSGRILVGIGLVSYSAYLWHQPLFAFARLRSFGEPEPLLMAGLSVAALALGWVTWRFVEQPFRRRSDPVLPTRRGVFAASGAGIVLLASVGLAGYLGDGLKGRLDDRLQRYTEANIPRAPQSGECTLKEFSPITYPVSGCRFPDSQGRVPVLLAGDSHAAAISEAVAQELSVRDIGHYHASYLGCLALPGFKPFGQISNRDCQGFAEGLYAYADHEGFQTLVLVGRYPWYLYGTPFDNEEGGVEAAGPVWYDLPEYPNSLLDDPTRAGRVLAAYEDRIRALAGRFNIVLVYPIPEAGWDVPFTAFRRTFITGEDLPLTTSYAAYKARNHAVIAMFDRLVAELPNLRAARVDEALCSEKTGRCVNVDATGVYYVDDDHLSTVGARRLAPMIAAAVASLSVRPSD